MRPVYANCSFALLDGFAFIPTRDGGSTTIFYFFLLHLCRTTVWTSVFWTTFGFLRNCLLLYDVSYSSQSERVCGKLYEERSYWTVPARALCFQCGTRFQICSHHPHPHPHTHPHPHNSANHRPGQRMHERVSRDDGRVEQQKSWGRLDNISGSSSSSEKAEMEECCEAPRLLCIAPLFRWTRIYTYSPFWTRTRFYSFTHHSPLKLERIL